jgi:alpha-tubulin suppressor-like RCC1 family protein
LANENGDIVKISAGDYHSIILKKNGFVYSFGYGLYFQLGVGPLNANSEKPVPPLNIYSGVADVCAGGSFSLILTENGKVYGFGTNNVIFC